MADQAGIPETARRAGAEEEETMKSYALFVRKSLTEIVPVMDRKDDLFLQDLRGVLWALALADATNSGVTAEECGAQVEEFVQKWT